MANSYLSRTPSSAGNRKTWTWSCWVQRSLVSSGTQTLFRVGQNDQLRFNSSNQLDWYTNNASARLITTRTFRDSSAWYHIMAVMDTTQGTSSNRMKIYVNGTQETSFGTANYPSQDFDTDVNNTTVTGIGYAPLTTNEYFDGYMSHVALVDGTALTPTTFGETDSTSGIWKFKSPSTTWGTNGFHLKFENSGNMGLDSSGQGNNFSSGGNLKQSLSNPTNIYSTLSNQIAPWASSTVATNGNSTITCPSGTEGVSMVTIGVNTGKWYCEMKQGDSNDVYIGVGAETFISDNLLNLYSGATHNATTGLLVKHSNGTRYVNGSSSSGIFASTGSGDVTGIALDLDAATRTVTFYKNGVADSAGSQNLPTNMQSGFLFPVCMVLDDSIVHLNTGDGFFGTTAITSAGSNGNGSLFEFDCPANHYAINTKNLNTYG